MNIKAGNQCDEFLCEIQRPKMKELWGNKKDATWNDA